MKELIEKLLNNIKSDITENQYGLGMIASGASASSLEVVAGDNSGSLLGSNYFHFQEFGRGPGKFPPRDSIEAWIEAKRITPPNEWTVRGFAFVIARKIAYQGSAIFRGEKQGLPVSQIITDNLSKFEEEFKEEFLKNFNPWDSK